MAGSELESAGVLFNFEAPRGVLRGELPVIHHDGGALLGLEWGPFGV